MEKELKKLRLENATLKTENTILSKLNSTSEFPLCMNAYISNLKKQIKVLEENNGALINKLKRKNIDLINSK